MASLTHVCIWSEKGWTPITAEEASRLHPTGGGVSYKSGLFRCDLCGQYVTFVDGAVYASHFKHINDTKSKDCPDRAQVSATINSFRPGVHTLPLKLDRITSDSFELQMGFIALPDELFTLVRNKTIRITAKGSAVKPLIYRGTRIQQECTTYLSLGKQISSVYTVEVQEHTKEIEQIWPRVVEGIDRDGALFDSQTGKKLPPDADVQIHHTYYLLTGKCLYRNRDVESRCISTVFDRFTRWMIYEIRATEFSEQAARFFMNYNCRLTENPVVTFPLWPACVENPYILLHKHRDIIMFLQGYCVKPKVFPNSNIRMFSTQDKDRMIFSLNSRERQQLLSAGRTKVLKYMYLRRTELSETAAVPVIDVTDIEGNPIHSLVQNTLPKGNAVVIHSPFDGMIHLYDGKQLIRKERLRAGEKTQINVYFGIELTAFQGLDLVFRLRFEKPAVSKNIRDAELARRLRQCHGSMMPVSHRLGSLATELKGYTETKLWLYQCIREGTMPKAAYQILTSIISKLR